MNGNGILLRMSGIHKRFPGAYALRGVDFDVRRGEVHALVGENGAGKSTLMHLIAGVFQPDEGSIAFDAKTAVRIGNEHAAQAMGISWYTRSGASCPCSTWPRTSSQRANR